MAYQLCRQFNIGSYEKNTKNVIFTKNIEFHKKWRGTKVKPSSFPFIWRLIHIVWMNFFSPITLYVKFYQLFKQITANHRQPPSRENPYLNSLHAFISLFSVLEAFLNSHWPIIEFTLEVEGFLINFLGQTIFISPLKVGGMFFGIHWKESCTNPAMYATSPSWLRCSGKRVVTIRERILRPKRWIKLRPEKISQATKSRPKKKEEIAIKLRPEGWVR